jgi:hypothetical protein
MGRIPARNRRPRPNRRLSIRAALHRSEQTATFGVAGSSFKASGVLGQSGPAPAFDPKLNYTGGVTGTSRDAAGVVAVSQNSFGVIATSQTSAGVSATSQKAAGVSAVSGSNSGVLAISGAQGPPNPDVPNVAGVIGTAAERPGVIGTSNKLMGVYGFSTNGIGIVGYTLNAASFAGYFGGNVLVTGTLTAAVKNGVIAFPDGTKRVLHCMESPEHWFEDFGTAKLKRGRTVVKLDADFAKVIKSGDYRVFVMPEGDCRGLYLHRKTSASFEVRELAGGKSSIAFSYRIVGRRKDIKGHRRFAKFDMRASLPAAPRRRPRKIALPRR